MKKVIFNIAGSICIISIGSIFGYLISKKRYSPKKTFGEIFIDYTDDPKHPTMYLNNLDPTTFSNNTKFIILGINHIRK